MPTAEIWLVLHAIVQIFYKMIYTRFQCKETSCWKKYFQMKMFPNSRYVIFVTKRYKRRKCLIWLARMVLSILCIQFIFCRLISLQNDLSRFVFSTYKPVTNLEERKKFELDRVFFRHYQYQIKNNNNEEVEVRGKEWRIRKE